MFSKRSIRRRFLVQLIIASAALVILFSSFLFLFIKQSIYDEKKTELVSLAQNIAASKSLLTSTNSTDSLMGVNVELINLPKNTEYLEF